MTTTQSRELGRLLEDPMISKKWFPAVWFRRQVASWAFIHWITAHFELNSYGRLASSGISCDRGWSCLIEELWNLIRTCFLSDHSQVLCVY